MIEHLVLFKFKPETTDEQIAVVLAALEQLPREIDGIAELSCGRNFSERSQGNQAALRVLFSTREQLDAYGPHPAHQRVVTELIRPIAELVTVVDYERA